MAWLPHQRSCLNRLILIVLLQSTVDAASNGRKQDVRETLRTLVAQGAKAQCDLPRLDARSLSWNDFLQRDLRGSTGVILKNLFTKEELQEWTASNVIAKYGNETFNADNTRGNYTTVRVRDYIERQDPGRMIFVSDSLLGVFGVAMRFTLRRHRRNLLRDFEERPLFSVGVEGSYVPKHGDHAETWHALLQGSKGWWLAPAAPSESPEEVGDAYKKILRFRGWEEPCKALRPTSRQIMPPGMQFCVQHAGEILYFGDSVPHADCSLEPFTIAVGAQGHTEDWPPWIRAANRGDAADIEKSMPVGKDPAVVLRATAGRYAHTALHRAALHGQTEAVEELLRLGAKADIPDDDGLPPIFLAAFSGHIPIVDRLARVGVGIKVVDGKGASVLQWASSQGHLPLVKHLVFNLSADVLAKDHSRGSGVSAAATMGHAGIVRFLLQQGADAEESDVNGIKPIHWGATQGHTSVVKALLAGKADASATDSYGQTAAQLADASGRQEVRKLLMTAEARSQGSSSPRSARSKKHDHEL